MKLSRKSLQNALKCREISSKSRKNHLKLEWTRRAVRPPSGGFLVERHNHASIEQVHNAFEGFRPGIYLVNILWKNDEKNRVPRNGPVLPNSPEARDPFLDPVSKDRMVSAFEAGADTIR